MKPINTLSLTVNTSSESLIQFDPEVKEYDVVVPKDCFGALLKLEYAPEFYISIRADRDAGRFGFADLDPEMGDYIAGSEIPYYDYYGGYIIRLDKREACFENDLDVCVTIDAGSSEHGTARYLINIHRDSGKELRALFEEHSFFDEEYGISMPYMIYVPTDYDPKKKYPLVTCLHGTGEIQEPISAVLMKTEMATVFAQDSEADLRKCIVLVPKCTIRYDEDDNWTTLNQFVRQRTDSPFYPMPHLTVAWRLIEKIEEEYSIDDKRLYLTGISSGAFGAYVLAMDHPHDFAALVAVCGAANPQRIDSLKHTPLWIFHSADDPLIVPAFTLDPTLAALDKAGIAYRLTLYPEKQVFWQTAHFCWEVAYKDEELREWVFAQAKGEGSELDKDAGDSADGTSRGHGIDEEVNDIATRAIAAASKLDSI
ncbi:MAG: alpha/beta hydrolase-fold protein [Coriobacteriales bacterium]|nr:alpha/beta hydrolase-fold protein [Coriobacteriales bacterium]